MMQYASSDVSSSKATYKIPCTGTNAQVMMNIIRALKVLANFQASMLRMERGER